MNNLLLCIAGPTCSGKTELAVQLASELNTEVLSADSRQFYREMNIGTAKPTTEEMRGVKHHFIDFISIHDDYSAGKFEKDALACLDGLFSARGGSAFSGKRKNNAILAGGSGLFIHAVCNGFDKIPDVDPSLRETLNDEFKNSGVDSLLEKLKTVDPEYYEAVDKKNQRRVIRALEICMTTGKKYSDIRLGNPQKRNFRVVKIGLMVEKEELRNRIGKRIDEMIRKGLVEEARSLYPYRDLKPLQTVGYSELFDYFNGKISLEDAIEKIRVNTQHYAKRQMTWFKKDKEIRWFNAEDNEKIVNFVMKNSDQLPPLPPKWGEMLPLPKNKTKFRWNK